MMIVVAGLFPGLPGLCGEAIISSLSELVTTGPVGPVDRPCVLDSRFNGNRPRMCGKVHATGCLPFGATGRILGCVVEGIVSTSEFF